MSIAKRDARGCIVTTVPSPRNVGYCECGDHAFVNLTKGYVTLVSTEDACLLEGRAWHAAITKNGVPYAYGRTLGEFHHVALHTLITKCPPGKETDHISHRTLDNRRSELRVIDKSSNSRNKKHTNSKSGYFGVSYHQQSRLWRGWVNIGGKQKSAGYFKNPAEAARARDLLCKQLGISIFRSNDGVLG